MSADLARPALVGRGRVAIRAARLIDGTGAAARRDPMVVIADGVIKAIEDAASVGDAGCPVVDLGDATLVPGYVDAHVHLAFAEVDAVPTEAVALLAAADRATAALCGGVTTARDLGGPTGVLLRLRAAIAEGIVRGPRLLVAGAPVTTPDGHCHWFGAHARTAAEVRRAVRMLTETGVDLIKLMLTGGMSTPTTDPYALQFPAEVARAAVEEAHRLGRPVAAHALGTVGVRVALAAGVDTLEHGWTITGRDQRFDPTVVPELAARPIVASLTAHHALRELLPAGHDLGDPEELRRRLVPHRALRAAGVPIVVHSDAGPGPTRFAGFGDSVAAFALGMDADAAAAIHAATLAPARAIGLGGTLGSLRPGRLADLVVLDGDPDRDPAAFRRVRDVYQGGRLVAHQGSLLVEPLHRPPSG